MNARAEPFVIEAAGYLVLDTKPTTLAIATDGILAVERLVASAEGAPSALSDLLPVEFAAPDPSWVLTLGSAADSTPLLVRGHLRIQYFPAASLVAMPTECAAGFDLFTHVVMEDAGLSALIINVGALCGVLRGIGN